MWGKTMLLTGGRQYDRIHSRDMIKDIIAKLNKEVLKIEKTAHNRCKSSEETIQRGTILGNYLDSYEYEEYLQLKGKIVDLRGVSELNRAGALKLLIS